jgi:hypothetical protein
VPGATAPDTCAAVIEVCNELDDAQCTGSNVIETGAAAADCTTAQAVICADQTCAFRWVRANFGTFTGSGATLKSILLGWQQ